jgi:ABC-type lipoprotein export system ATPase subunit
MQPLNPGSPAPPRLVLRDLKSPLAGPFDLTLEAGERLAVSGPSGSGKSLLLRMIADLDPNTGHAWLDGVARDSLGAPEWRRRVPYVAAESGWWRDTPAEHFAPQTQGAARKLAERLGVRGQAFDEEVRRLSTGERQRLAIIRALVLDTPVLLLDEPTGPLDPDSTARVEAVLAERAAAGTSIVLVSHDPAQAGRLGARRMRMADRRLEPVAG